MPEYRRARREGGTFFFTVVSYGRRPFLTSNVARRCLREAWQETQEKEPFVIDAVCLMPDHLHCVWTLPENDKDYSGRWRRLKGQFSVKMNAADMPQAPISSSRVKHGEAGFWQRRFWEHEVRDEDDFQRIVEYIHYNPVKHGLVSRPLDWPWSSFHRYVREGFHEADWGSSEPESLKDEWECGE